MNYPEFFLVILQSFKDFRETNLQSQQNIESKIQLIGLDPLLYIQYEHINLRQSYFNHYPELKF